MQGKIVKGIAGFYYIYAEDGNVYECKAKGIFRKDNFKPLVGDNVEITVLDEEKKILVAQMANDPKMASKPDAVKEKIAAGKLNKFYEENCLLQQEFVKDNSMSVEKYIAASAKELGGSIEFASAVRFEKGEGIEKKQENFADEIASMVKG